jgi:hypothetical protein
MKQKISTLVLWACMLITIGIFGFFYSGIINDPEEVNTVQISLILNWLYVILIVSIAVTCIFSLMQFLFKWKRDRQSMLQPSIGICVVAAILIISYVSGDGNILPIQGYKGNENTYFWLKLTDMWIYTLYVLLALAIIALFGGIIWSHIKKTK